ncbi:unnamed protein product [Cylindrotheca closterium]|uniref:Uncharacterized protein n=1 Tax=Cylindrotheca closterium TaxID=2856 RepID=A0AAD2G1I8_9STRA|nr:unnamed protein product [Cylindrotheca closterium]
MMKFKQTLVRKSKITSAKGFASPSKPGKRPSLEVKSSSGQTKTNNNDDGDDSEFEPGDEHFGSFGDMQDGNGDYGGSGGNNDSDIEEVSLEDLDSDEDSEFSERTVDEEEYELYMNTADIHKIPDFEEWRNSEHFPQHLFDSDDEYDEITVDSVELHESLKDGGLVVDWTGARITLDTYTKDAKEEKKKKRKKKKTTKIKVKKSKKSKSEKKKKRKNEKRNNKLEKANSSSAGSKESSGQSEKSNRKSLKEKLAKESVKKVYNGEDSSRDSSLLSLGTKTMAVRKQSPKRSSSKASLNGSNDSLTIQDLDGLNTPTSSPVGARATRKRLSSKKSPGKPSRRRSSSKPSSTDESISPRGKESVGHSTDDTDSLNNSSGDIPGSKCKSCDSSEFESPRLRKGTRKSFAAGNTDSIPKSPGSSRSPHIRASPLGRRGGRRSSSKPNIWAESMATLNKPELGKSFSTGTDDGTIQRRSNSRRSIQSPKRRRSSVENPGADSPIPRRSNSCTNGANSPIPRRSNSSVSGANAPIPRRSSSRRISKNSKRQDMDSSGHTTASNNKQKSKSAKLLSMERMAREGAEQYTSSALEKRKGSHAALREKLAKAGTDESTHPIKDKYCEGAGDMKQKRSSSLDALKKRRDQADDSSVGSTSAGWQDEKVTKRLSLSAGVAPTSRRRLRVGSKRNVTELLPREASSGSLVSLDIPKGSFDPFSVADDIRNGSRSIDVSDRTLDNSMLGGSSLKLVPSKRDSLASSNHGNGPISLMGPRKSPSGRNGSRSIDVSDRTLDNSTLGSSSQKQLVKRPSKRDSLASSNHGKGPISLMSPRKSPSGRKKAQPPRRRSSGLPRNSGHSANGPTLSRTDAGISSKDITW